MGCEIKSGFVKEYYIGYLEEMYRNYKTNKLIYQTNMNYQQYLEERKQKINHPDFKEYDFKNELLVINELLVEIRKEKIKKLLGNLS